MTNVSNLKLAKIISTTHTVSLIMQIRQTLETFWSGGGMYELAFLRTQGVKRLCEQWAMVRFTY